MRKTGSLITILIIGKDTSHQLKDLLCSIDAQNTKIQDKINILYVDDCSNDRSVDVFKNHSGKFDKQCIVNSECLGRAEARNVGIRNAIGEYILFLNSNVKIIGINLIESYHNAINSGVYAGFGKVRYTCKDKRFEKYLNHLKRGTNGFENRTLLSPGVCLFSNCIIKKSILDNIGQFNKNLIDYGGEELDLAFRIQNNTIKLVHISTSIVIRNNHPGPFNHASRVEIFGKTNFLLLGPSVQKLILPYKVFTRPKGIVFAFFLLFYIARGVLKYPLVLIGNKNSFKCLLGLYFYYGIYSGLLDR